MTALGEFVFKLVKVQHKTVTWNEMTSNCIVMFSFSWIMVTFERINHSLKFKLFHQTPWWGTATLLKMHSDNYFLMILLKLKVSSSLQGTPLSGCFFNLTLYEEIFYWKMLPRKHSADSIRLRASDGKL